MKNIKSYKILGLAGMLAVGLWASSCLKDDRVDFSSVGNVVELLDATPGASVPNALVSHSYPDTVLVRVNVAGPNALGQDLSVTLAVDQAALDTYNLDTLHAPADMLPDSVFDIPNLTVTIESGTDALGNINRTGTLLVLIDAAKIDLSYNYVLPISITDASGQTISGNFGTILLGITVKNRFDGHYTVTGAVGTAPDYVGSFVDTAVPTITGDYPMDMQLLTTSSNESRAFSFKYGTIYHPILSAGASSVYGNVGMRFIFNDADDVINVLNYYTDPPPRMRTLALFAGVNHYDESTHVMEVSYVLNQQSASGCPCNPRTTFKEVWTRIGD